MLNFLPREIRQAFELAVADELGIPAQGEGDRPVAATYEEASTTLSIEVGDGSYVEVGGVRMPVNQNPRLELVPKTLFFEMQHQLGLLRNLDGR